MADTVTYLSPNGQSLTQGKGPATHIMVATLKGVATLSRAGKGKPWKLAERTLEHRHIGSLVYEPHSGKLFAGAHADGGMWVSDDGRGADWRPLTVGLDRPHIYSLAARDVGGKVTLFAGTSPAALYRSDDLGESWTELKSMLDVPDTDKWTFPPPPHIPHVKNIVFHPKQAKTIYVAVEQGALLKSTDDGKSWIELAAYSDPDEVAYRDVHRLMINPKNPKQFYLATGEGLYRSEDGGASFEHLTHRGERLGYPDFLFFDPDDLGTIYVGGSYRNPGYWYEAAKAESCVLRMSDRGHKWVELNNGLPYPVVGAFEAMTMHHWKSGMMLVVGTATGQIYASEDAGASWQLIAENVTPVSKDDHHLPFLTPEERQRHAAERGIAVNA